MMQLPPSPTSILRNSSVVSPEKLPIPELRTSSGIATSFRDNIPPRVPPTEIVSEFVPGEFAYISQGQQYLQDAYRVISINEWWGPFKDYLLKRGVSKNTGFMFTDDPFYRNIMNAISNTPVGGGHSGSSMGFCMRVMEEIALYGEPAYRNKCIAYNGN